MPEFAYYGPEDKRDGATAAVESLLADPATCWVDVLRVYYRSKPDPVFQIVCFGGDAGKDDVYWIPDHS